MPERDAPPAATTTVLALDFGRRRIGVAVGQSVTASASPLGTVANGDSGPDVAALERLIDEWRPDRLVVGLPLSADGGPSELVPEVRAFVRWLGRFGLDIDTVDERHSSQEAAALLISARQGGSRGRIRKGDVDAAAAVVIAERYLAAL
ncbi:MAG: Holliday junction resolvase RuvX [Woeseiaceae bacterium]|nr:Holliday junction resolvase RuvX [Woeseiaceae bacterium]